MDRLNVLHFQLLVSLLCGLGTLFAAAPTHAATTFTVTVVADEIDKQPGNGKCLTANGGCSLRAAIMESNALAGAQEIVLPDDQFELTRDGVDDSALYGDLDITGSVTIRGAGAGRTIIVGESPERVLHAKTPSAVVDMSGVTIGYGALDDGLTGLGGGGILNEGTLRLKNARVVDNYCDYGLGAGIANYGTLTMDRVVMIGNSARGDAGALYYPGTARLSNVTIQDNNAFNGGLGGGIANSGTLTLTASTIRGNIADDIGGGVYTSGDLTITNTTISGNRADAGGAGIYNGGGLTITNTTISGNETQDWGAGIHSTGTVRARNLTIALNRADDDLNGIGTGGGVYNDGGAFTFSNSIIARNYDSNDVGGSFVRSLSDCTGPITAAGTNILQWVEDHCTITGDPSNGGDDTTLLTNPEIGALRNNGGPTATHALQSDSPAIDASTNPCPSKDQRGRSRVDGDGNGTVRCDIGAYEFKGQ